MLTSLYRCEHYNNTTQRGHLVLRNLDEYNIPYLAALLSNNQDNISVHEQHALQQGYGPLIKCNFMASPSEQKSFCRESSFLSNGLMTKDSPFVQLIGIGLQMGRFGVEF